ncbi:MAG: hypothetical protein Q8K98_09360 [Bacteroidota bacterium]|nr:hypothetical protein [Bacteroidota bacterium]
MTRDIDIVIELGEGMTEKFISLFPDSYYDKATIKDAIKTEGMFNIIDHQTGFKIDFIIRKNNEYHNLAFNRRKRIKEFDTWIWVISIEDLIISKINWIQEYQSDRQIFDIQNLLLNTEKDTEYIKKWCTKLKLNTFNLFDDE